MEGRVASVQIVPALNKLKDRQLGLCGGIEAAALQQLALQGGKEALAQRVVVTIPDGAHRRTYARLFAARAKGHRGVLRALVGAWDHLLWTPLPDRHVQRLQEEFRPQVLGHGPAPPPP